MKQNFRLKSLRISLLLSLILSIISIGFAKEATSNKPATVTPSDRPNEWWQQRHKEKLAEAKQGNIDYIMIGDSITQAWDKQRSFPACLAPLKVLNLGYGGDRTQHAIWRIQNGEIDGLNPKLISIMIGTNNVSRDTTEDIALGVKTLVSELRQRLPETKIALLSIFPRDHPRIKGDRQLTEAVNALLPAIAAKDDKITFHDFAPHFLNQDKSLNAKLYGRDLLHLSDEGYSTWAKALHPIITKAGLKIDPPSSTSKPAKTNKTTSPPATNTQIVRLWSLEKIGGEKNRLKEKYRERKNGAKQLCGVLDPNITIYPTTKNTGKPSPAVIYSPGGGYGILSIPDAAHIKEWNNLGITLIVLKYRIPKLYDAAFEDIQRAVKLVRHNAAKWNINPDQIGLFGNSAGGHLSSRLMNNYDQITYEPIDAADKLSCAPNFAVLQCSAYFNGVPRGEALDQKYFQLKNKVAPTFLTYSKDDIHYPGGQNYADAINKAGYHITLKLYEKGGHGMKNCDWFAEATKWMKSQNIIK